MVKGREVPLFAEMDLPLTWEAGAETISTARFHVR